MQEIDIDMIVQRCREKYTDTKPRGITAKGPQYIFGDFKVFIRIAGMTHVKTSSRLPLREMGRLSEKACKLHYNAKAG